MSGDDVFQSFDNAWRALCKQYIKCPDETLRNAINALGKILNNVKQEIKEYEGPHQITIDDWLQFLSESEENK